jgi:hypothetical protein
MSANTSADALSKFLASSVDEAASGGQLIDQLGQALLPSGDAGLAFNDAMALAKLSRPDFLTTLSRATSAGLVEAFADNGEQKLRLTAAGRSLY